ncbi:abortive infection protein [Acidovorax sp. KKS102]|uniref:AAA family ATPase n=1 Tax=Acidovorax sp. KKS102 TaxID=358220 RepID=UPI00028B0ABD|nr:ATP-binding protein [Acidovorax sp. KKS102]AFU46086.1 abortive infection protein [Acidovorax sp. KKS102]
MLLEFGFRNFYSFREGASISFRLDANCPHSISLGKPFSTVVGIKGANGSGKTQILKALAFISSFAHQSFSQEIDAPIPIFPFFNSKDPSEFYVEFMLQGVIYNYELSCTQEKVLSEVLYSKISKRVKIIERINNEIIYASKKYSAIKGVRLRSNASLISTARQYEIKEILNIAEYFSDFPSNVNTSGYRERQVSIATISELLAKSVDMLSRVNRFLQECDVGLSAVKIIETQNPTTGKKEFSPIFIHKHDESEHPVAQHFESSGTKLLFRYLPMYIATLELGGVAVVDEFDVHLHPQILPKILELFTDPEKNPNHAQLLFTTHDTEILNNLGKYRSYLVNKVNNESFAYRLDEIAGDLIRNDRPISPLYRDKKIGGVPCV